MISQTSEYALRAISFLAKQYPELTTASEIAATTLVPHAYLVKVLQALRRAGIVTSQRGIGGGVRLGVPPSQLTMLQVINAVEPVQRIRACPLGLASHRSKLCSLHSRLDKAMALIEEVLSESTLAEMLAEPPTDAPSCRFPHARPRRAKPASSPRGRSPDG
jgi:Rrf2 family protein